MSSINLERTCDATANSGYSNKWTFSAWVKRGLIGTEQGLFGNKRPDDNNNSRFRLRIKSTDRLCWEIKDSSGNDDSSFETNMLLRDVGAWFHVVFIFDSNNSTESERMKCYINGKDVRTELGGFSSVNETGSGFGSLWSSSIKNYLGVTHDASGNPYRWDGLMSHVHFTYGYRYEASTFGSTDSTTGEWKINVDPSVTYGSQGFWLFKDNAAVTDQSGEGNDFTLNNGTLTATKDNPSNNFATLNNTSITLQGTATYAHGNTIYKCSSSNWGSAVSTIMPNSGKWYFESQVTDNDGQKFMMGICDLDNNPEFFWQSHPYLGYRGYSYYGDGKYLGTNSSGTHNSDLDTSLTQTNNNDVIGMAVDLDNKKLYTHINGTYLTYGGGTQNPSTSSYGLDIQYGITGGNVCFGVSSRENYNIYANFGNGVFRETALTGTTYQDSKSRGIFKHQPPTNFLALCTSNLNE